MICNLYYDRYYDLLHFIIIFSRGGRGQGLRGNHLSNTTQTNTYTYKYVCVYIYIYIDILIYHYYSYY